MLDGAREMQDSIVSDCRGEDSIIGPRTTSYPCLGPGTAPKFQPKSSCAVTWTHAQPHCGDTSLTARCIWISDQIITLGIKSHLNSIGGFLQSVFILHSRKTIRVVMRPKPP